MHLHTFFNTTCSIFSKKNPHWTKNIRNLKKCTINTFEVYSELNHRQLLQITMSQISNENEQTYPIQTNHHPFFHLLSSYYSDEKIELKKISIRFLSAF